MLLQTNLQLRDRSAVLSACEKYRYRLERAVGAGRRTACITMVNPSTADAVEDDATIRKWIGFSRHLSVGHIIVGNKFAYRSTRVGVLREVSDPVGPDNDRHLREMMREADLHIVAWGRLAKLDVKLRNRWTEVVKISESLGCKLHCLGCTADGHPKHPLLLSYATALQAWDYQALDS